MTAQYKGNGRSVVIDDETALWCARMLVGEGYKGDKGASVLWATLFRFLGMPKKWKSYRYMIRAFSSPINSRWLPGGSLYEKYKDSKNKAHQMATSPQAVKRRTKIIGLTWDKIPETVKNTVQLFADGSLPIPSEFGDEKLSNFASYPGLKEKHPEGVDIGGDWFFVDPALKKNFEVQIFDATPPDTTPPDTTPPDTSPLKNPKAGFAAGILLLMVAYWLMKTGKV
jgi:hypothetical protein